VAIKVLTAELDENRDRFLREQRAMGRLTGHPNIVSVLQVGETENGLPVPGDAVHRHGSLEARIRQLGLLPLEEVLRLGVKMAGALETAHRLGIVHRDVKPGNILLTDYGEPALSDFGIAHIAGGFKTSTGTFTGSPAFHGAEILSGDPPSRSSDVYGLGATLFAALTVMRRSSAAVESSWWCSFCASPVNRRRTCVKAVSPTSSPQSSKGQCPATRTTDDGPGVGRRTPAGSVGRGLPVDEMAQRGGAQSHHRKRLRHPQPVSAVISETFHWS